MLFVYRPLNRIPRVYQVSTIDREGCVHCILYQPDPVFKIRQDGTRVLQILMCITFTGHI